MRQEKHTRVTFPLLVHNMRHLCVFVVQHKRTVGEDAYRSRGVNVGRRVNVDITCGT